MEERARFDALLGTLTRVIADRDAPAQAASDARAYFASCGAEHADVDVLANAPGRVFLYRKLVRRGLASAIRNEIPRTAARLGQAFDALCDRFLDEMRPRSHYLRDVAFEFAAWATPELAKNASIPAYVAELMAHELSLYEVGSAPDRPREELNAEPAEVELDRAVRFDPSARLFHYDHAVHAVCEGAEGSSDAPERRETWLFGYRDAEHEVRYLALSQLAAGIVSELLAGATLRGAMTKAAQVSGHTLDDSVLGGAATLLTDLQERGALLGGARPPASAKTRSRSGAAK